jgi:hypothetical protein
LVLTLKEEVELFFYVEDVSTADYQFFLEIQMLSQEGELCKLGAARYSLMVQKDASKQNIMVLFNNLYRDKQQQAELQAMTQAQHRGKGKTGKHINEPLELFVGKIKFELDTEPVKDIKRYLPPFKIIDKNSRIAPTSFNLKKKKEQIVVEASHQLILNDLLLRIENVENFKKQLVNNNPFTFSHKDLV